MSEYCAYRGDTFIACIDGCRSEQPSKMLTVDLNDRYWRKVGIGIRR